MIVGFTGRISPAVGLFGYVSTIWIKEGHPATYYVKALRKPELETDRDIDTELQGRFDSTGVSCKEEDIVWLTDPKQVARVVAMKTIDEADEAEPETEEERKSEARWAAFFERTQTEEYKAKERATKAAILAEREKIIGVFTLPGAITRSRKSGFAAYSHPDVRKLEHEVMMYAQCDKLDDLSPMERARWSYARELIDQTSFWPDMDEVRDLVAELELDPMADEFNYALYRDIEDDYVPTGSLRDKGIQLWNQGAIILRIQAMNGPQTCWSYEDKEQPSGYSVKYGFRRQLPIKNAYENTQPALSAMQGPDEPLLSQPVTTSGRRTESKVVRSQRE